MGEFVHLGLKYYLVIWTQITNGTKYIVSVQFCAGAQIIRTKDSFLPCKASALFLQVLIVIQCTGCTLSLVWEVPLLALLEHNPHTRQWTLGWVWTHSTFLLRSRWVIHDFIHTFCHRCHIFPLQPNTWGSGPLLHMACTSPGVAALRSSWHLYRTLIFLCYYFQLQKQENPHTIWIALGSKYTILLPHSYQKIIGWL